MLDGKFTVITPFVPELQLTLLTVVVNVTGVAAPKVIEVVAEQLVMVSVSVTP